MPKLTKRLIDGLSGETGDRIEWDNELRGFGVRVQPKGAKSFVIQYRNTSGRSRRHTIGQFGAWTVDAARAEARALLVDVDKGGDPAGDRQTKRAAPTVADLMERYIADHVTPHNAASTAEQIRDIVAKRILPALGSRKIADIDRDDVEQFQRQLAGTPRMANLSLSILSKAFNLAEAGGSGRRTPIPVAASSATRRTPASAFLFPRRSPTSAKCSTRPRRSASPGASTPARRRRSASARTTR